MGITQAEDTMKKEQQKTNTLFVTILVLLSSLLFLPSNLVAKSPRIEVVIKVSNQGFFNEAGQPVDNLLKVPQQSDIRLIFEYMGDGEDYHEFSLLFDSGEELYADPISYLNKRASVEFSTGEHLQKIEIFCVVDCEGMKNLLDLVLVAT